MEQVQGLRQSPTKLLNKAVDFRDLSENIEELTLAINVFSQGILQTYEVSETSDLAEIVYIRSQVIEHALAYTTLVSPKCRQLMKEVREIFDTIHNVDDVGDFMEILDYLCETSTKAAKGLGVCEQLHETTKTFFKADEKMASTVVTQLASANQGTKDIVEKARVKTVQLTNKKERAKENGGGIFENSLKAFDSLAMGIPVGTFIGKGLDWGVNAYKRREIRKLLNSATAKEPNAIKLLVVEQQINVTILPAIRLFIKTLDKIKEILNEFTEELAKLDKNDSTHLTKLNQYFANVKKHADSIQSNALRMITYFNNCEAEINVFNDVEKNRVNSSAVNLHMQKVYGISSEGTSTLSETLKTTLEANKELL